VQTGTAPAQDHRGQHPAYARSCAGWAWRTTPAQHLHTDIEFYRWTQWIFLQIYNSWYDERVRRARPITELEAEFRRRHPPCGRHLAVGRARCLRRRQLIDSYRLPTVRGTGQLVSRPGHVLANEEVTADGAASGAISRCSAAT